MLNILSGYQTANLKSFPVKNGVQFTEGEWAMFNADGKLVKMEETDVFNGTKAVFPVFAGNKKYFDTKYLGEVDVVTAKSGILETDVLDAVSFAAGDPVFVKNGKVTNSATAGTGAKAVGFAIEAAGNNVAGKRIVKFALA